MTKEELITRLVGLKERWDTEAARIEADKALLEFINDEQVTRAFDDIDKWYA